MALCLMLTCREGPAHLASPYFMPYEAALIRHNGCEHSSPFCQGFIGSFTAFR